MGPRTVPVLQFGPSPKATDAVITVNAMAIAMMIDTFLKGFYYSLRSFYF